MQSNVDSQRRAQLNFLIVSLGYDLIPRQSYFSLVIFQHVGVRRAKPAARARGTSAATGACEREVSVSIASSCDSDYLALCSKPQTYVNSSHITMAKEKISAGVP